MKRVTDKDIPELKPHVGSWIIVRKETNKVVGEVQKANRRVLKSLNADTLNIIPADKHLSALS